MSESATATGTSTALATQTRKHAIATTSVFSSIESFTDAQRMCQALAASNFVPKEYQNHVANCLIALDMSLRMQLSPMVVMQNLNIIHGRPSWSSTFIISAINASGLFSPLRFEFNGKEGGDEWSCYAVARDLASGDTLRGPSCSIKMAKDEGWYDRKNRDGQVISKWRTMPQLMLTYRAAAFFGRIYAAHILSGMSTTEEAEDIGTRLVEGERVDSPAPAQTSEETAKADLISRARAPRKTAAPKEEPAAPSSGPTTIEHGAQTQDKAIDTSTPSRDPLPQQGKMIDMPPAQEKQRPSDAVTLDEELRSAQDSFI